MKWHPPHPIIAVTVHVVPLLTRERDGRSSFVLLVRADERSTVEWLIFLY